MIFNAYIVFHGNAEEALEHYRGALGGEIQIMRYSESPEAETVGAAWGSKVMHGTLRSAGGQLMVSDATDERWKDITPGNNFSLCISTEAESEADSAFGRLSDGGNVTMPMEKTFWGAKFGMLTDRFGINWMVNCQLEPAGVTS